MVEKIQSRIRQSERGNALLSKKNPLTLREMQYIIALFNRLDRELSVYENHFGSALNMQCFIEKERLHNLN